MMLNAKKPKLFIYLFRGGLIITKLSFYAKKETFYLKIIRAI